MNFVLARLAPGRAVDADTFADLTDATVLPDGDGVVWEADGWLRVTFDRDLTDGEAAAVRRRMRSADAADEAVRVEVAKFLATNDPNRLQIVAMLKLLIPIVLGDTEQSPD